MNKSIKTYLILLLLAIGLMACTKNKKVPIHEHFYAPNTFSPNGDGLNELFLLTPTYGTQIADFHIRIYNDQLKEIFSSDSYNEFKLKGWDGKFGDEEMPTGFYDYQIEYSASTDSLSFDEYLTSSNINLLR